MLRTERSVRHLHLVDQLRDDVLQLTQVTLAVPLGRLVLGNIVHQHAQAAGEPPVVEVEAEPTPLKRFPTALVLAGTDPCAQRVQQLVSSRCEDMTRKRHPITAEAMQVDTRRDPSSDSPS